MIKILLASVLVVSNFSMLWSQQNIANDSSNTAVDKNKMIAKIEVGNIINPVDPTLLLALEFPLNERVSFSQELGLVMGYRGDQSILDEFIGFKVREELRFYFDNMSFGEARPFLSLSGMYRFMTITQAGNVGYGCTSGDLWSCDFLQQAEEAIDSHQFGGALKFGFVKTVLPRLTLEGDAGLSLRYLNFQDNQGSDVTYFFRNDVNLNQTSGASVVPVFSIKIGYKL